MSVLLFPWWTMQNGALDRIAPNQPKRNAPLGGSQASCTAGGREARENIETTLPFRVKKELTTLIFASALVLAATLAMSPQSSTPDACLKLRMHTGYGVDIKLAGSSIAWDGIKITPSQFNQYLRQQRTTEPGAIFLVHWDQSGRKSVPEITEEIRSAGYAVAMNCPPIPF